MPLFRSSTKAKLRKRGRVRAMVRRAYMKLKGLDGYERIPAASSSGDISSSPFATSTLQENLLNDVNDTHGSAYGYPMGSEIALINQHEPTIRLNPTKLTITKNDPMPTYWDLLEAEQKTKLLGSATSSMVDFPSQRETGQYAYRPFTVMEDPESMYVESESCNASIICLYEEDFDEPSDYLISSHENIASAFNGVGEEYDTVEENQIEDDWILVEALEDWVVENIEEEIDSECTFQSSLAGIYDKQPESSINKRIVDAIARAPAPKTLGQVVDLSLNCAGKVEPDGIGFPIEINLNAKPHESEVKADPIRCIPNLRRGLINQNDGVNEDSDVSSDNKTIVAPEAPEFEQPVEAPNLPCESIESDKIQPDEDRASNGEIPPESEMSSEVVLELTTDCESNEGASGPQSVEAVENLPDTSSKRSISSRIYTRFQQLKPQRKPKVDSKCTLKDFKLKKPRTLRGALFKCKRKLGIKYTPKPIETKPSESQEKRSFFGFLSAKSPKPKPSPVPSLKDNWKRQKDERYLTRRLRFLVMCNNLFGAVPANAASCVGKARLNKFTTRRKSLIMRVLHRVSPL